MDRYQEDHLPFWKLSIWNSQEAGDWPVFGTCSVPFIPGSHFLGKNKKLLQCGTLKCLALVQYIHWYTHIHMYVYMYNFTMHYRLEQMYMLMRYMGLLLHKEWSLSWLFDTAGHRASLVLFRVDWFFEFMVVNAESAISHKYAIKSGTSIFRTLSETVGSSVLFCARILLTFFKKWNSSQQHKQEIFKSNILTQYNPKRSINNLILRCWGLTVEKYYNIFL